MQTKPKESPPRLTIHDLARRNGNAEFAEDVRRGLSSNPKQLFPKYLYDSLGSRLFDAICHVDEYYPTRAENEILTRHADEMVAAIPDCRTLIELGSGSADKTRRIIEALLRLQSELLFIPVDISASALEKSSRALLAAYPALRIEAYAADYLEGLAAMQPLPDGPALMLFLWTCAVCVYRGLRCLTPGRGEINLFAVGALAGLLCVLAHGMVEPGTYIMMKFVWIHFLLGLLLGVDSLRRAEAKALVLQA